MEGGLLISDPDPTKTFTGTITTTVQLVKGKVVSTIATTNIDLCCQLTSLGPYFVTVRFIPNLEATIATNYSET